jgi:hypothetical protein
MAICPCANAKEGNKNNAPITKINSHLRMVKPPNITNFFYLTMHARQRTYPCLQYKSPGFQAQKTGINGASIVKIFQPRRNPDPFKIKRERGVNLFPFLLHAKL